VRETRHAPAPEEVVVQRREFLTGSLALAAAGPAAAPSAEAASILPERLIWQAVAIIPALAPLPSRKSHFGGKPSVPSGFIWPEWKGKALDFLLVVDLAEVADLQTNLDLPKSGRLLFFYDAKEQPWGHRPEHAGGARVVFLPGGVAVEEPSEGGSGSFPRVAATFGQIGTVPDPWSTWVDDLEPSADRRDAMSDLLDRFAYDGPQLGGHARPIQGGTMDIECEWVASGRSLEGGWPDEAREIAFRRRAQAWRLLAQIDSDETRGMQWGDVGCLYFWIREDDLARRDFSGVRVILQCY
jgi:uncharacterized protein YwqG